MKVNPLYLLFFALVRHLQIPRVRGGGTVVTDSLSLAA